MGIFLGNARYDQLFKPKELHLLLLLAVLSLAPSQVPEWAKHQWQAINERHISGTCEKVMESMRVIIYDDLNMRNYFLKDTQLANYCLDILLVDSKEVH